MSRSSFRTALSAVFLLALVTVAGCNTRPSAEYYEALVTKLRAEGKLRAETAPQNAPYDANDLVRNFERIALHHEAKITRPGSEGNWEQNPLQRWVGPLNYRLSGSAVTAQDRGEVAALMNRIAGLTGLEIAETEVGWNFLILITTPEEQEEFSAVLAQLLPETAKTFDLWRQTPRLICVAHNLFSSENRNHIVSGLVSIGSETGGLLRRACLHEEIVQALGLANDHPDVRPSIFNDDGEFALLTEHDEHLLRILYDRRLEPGMTAAQAMPIVRRIVAELPLGQPPAQLATGTVAPAAIADTSGSRPQAAQVAPGN
ncbi:MAG: DUF2927 domain-containing protein [Alphaproteobacteria bacterium]